MIQVKTSKERGHANHGWLDSHHTFSFANYYDPANMGFRALRVINEDLIDGGMGFGMHAHRDMEIITYMVEGSLQHEDSMGNKEVIRPGEVQRMTAGTGVRHSEMNPDAKQAAHLLQIWILPKNEGTRPGYEQKDFAAELKEHSLVLAVSNDGREGSISIDQDVDLYLGKTKSGEKHSFTLRSGRHAWLQLVKGNLNVQGRELKPGDALAATNEKSLAIKATSEAEFLLFDLA